MFKSGSARLIQPVLAALVIVGTMSASAFANQLCTDGTDTSILSQAKDLCQVKCAAEASSGDNSGGGLHLNPDSNCQSTAEILRQNWQTRAVNASIGCVEGVGGAFAVTAAEFLNAEEFKEFRSKCDHDAKCRVELARNLEEFRNYQRDSDGKLVIDEQTGLPKFAKSDDAVKEAVKNVNIDDLQRRSSKNVEALTHSCQQQLSIITARLGDKLADAEAHSDDQSKLAIIRDRFLQLREFDPGCPQALHLQEPKDLPKAPDVSAALTRQFRNARASSQQTLEKVDKLFADSHIALACYDSKTAAELQCYAITYVTLEYYGLPGGGTLLKKIAKLGGRFKDWREASAISKAERKIAEMERLDAASKSAGVSKAEAPPAPPQQNLVSATNGHGTFNGEIVSQDNGRTKVKAVDGPYAPHTIEVDPETVGPKVTPGGIKVGRFYTSYKDGKHSLRLRAIHGRTAELVDRDGKIVKLPLENLVEEFEAERVHHERPAPVIEKPLPQYSNLGVDTQKRSAVTRELQNVSNEKYGEIVSQIFQSPKKQNTLVVSDFHLGKEGSRENFDKLKQFVGENRENFKNGKVVVGGDIYDQSQLSKWLEDACGKGARSLGSCSEEQRSHFQATLQKAQGDAIQELIDAGKLRNDQLTVQFGNHDFARASADRVGGLVVYDPTSLRETRRYFEERFKGIHIAVDPDSTQAFHAGNGTEGQISHFQQPPARVDLPVALGNDGSAVSNASGALADQNFVGDSRISISGDNHISASYFGDYHGLPCTYLSAGNLGGSGAQFTIPGTRDVRSSGLFHVILEDGRPVTYGPCKDGKTCLYTDRARRAEDYGNVRVKGSTPIEQKQAKSAVQFAKADDRDSLISNVGEQIRHLPRESKNKLYRLLEQSPSFSKNGFDRPVGKIHSGDRKIAEDLVREIPGLNDLKAEERELIVNKLLEGCK